MNVRHAAVEGRFYPSSKSEIFDQIRLMEREQRYSVPDMKPTRVFGGVIPHAGHVYSGHQTVPFFKFIQGLEQQPDTYLILHPNHSGFGEPIAIDDSKFWVNSAGRVPVDLELAAIMDLPMDSMAHVREHSAEVIIPFMQYFLRKEFSIVPICMREQTYENAQKVARRINEAATRTKREVMVLASCDFSHFITPEEGRRRDDLVMDKILDRDPRGVESVVREERISVCGYGPIMTLMEYAGSQLPEYRLHVLARGHSGEVMPSPEVVDYISMMVYQ